MNLERKAVVVIIMLFTTLLISGCINIEFPETTRDRRIVEMYTTVELGYDEVININATLLKNEINKTEMIFRDNSDKPPNYHPIFYYIYMPSDEYEGAAHILKIQIILATGTSVGRLEIFYRNSTTWESNLDEQKEIVKENVDFIASLGNITIDWEAVKWNYTYAY